MTPKMLRVLHIIEPTMGLSSRCIGEALHPSDYMVREPAAKGAAICVQLRKAGLVYFQFPERVWRTTEKAKHFLKSTPESS